MKYETVHPTEGRKPSPKSLFTPEGNVRVVRNLLRRIRPLVSQAMAAEIDAGLEALEDLRVGLGDRS